MKAHYTRGASEKDAEEAIRKMVDFSTTARSPAQRSVQAAAQKANSYVQPSTFDILAGASPASAMDGWAE